jgi:hypothetical protein
MSSPERTETNERVYGDFRRLIAEKRKVRVERRRIPMRMLLEPARIAVERFPQLLQGSRILVLAACLSAALAGMTVFLPQSETPQVMSEAPENATTLQQMESLLLQGDSVMPLVEKSAEVPVAPLRQISRSEPGDSFMVRVGSFRVIANATRVVESLQEKNLEVRTEVRADGLHVIMLGPFTGRGAAEDAARVVRETVNVVPQLIRHEPDEIAARQIVPAS